MIIGIEAAHANKKYRTGVEEYCFEIIQHLKKIIPADTRVVLYSNEPLRDDLAELPPNWSVRILSWPFKKGWSQIRLSAHFLRCKPDIFFAPGQLVPFICPKNTATTVHDSAFEVFPRAYGFAGRQYLKIMNWLILRKSKLIITPSEFTRRELGRIYNFDLSRVQAIKLGYDRGIFHPFNMGESEKKIFLDKYKIQKPFYLSIGRLEEKKNTVNIIRAFDLIKKSVDAELVLAGPPGRGFEEVKRAAAGSLNEKDIKLLGWVAGEELPKFYNLAVALLFPSLYEGFGIPVLAAMAAGCPVVASRGNSLEEVGADAVLYASAGSPEEIARAGRMIFGDVQVRASLTEKGLRRAADFSWENTANATWQALRKAVN